MPGKDREDLKIILGEFLEPEGHVKFFLETGLDGKGMKFSLKVGDFCTFWGGRQGTSLLTDLAQIWNHEAFGVPLHLVKSIFIGTITYKAIPANLPKLVKFYRFSPMWTYCRTTTILGT